MKILLIGASGTIGSAIKKELSTRQEIISAGFSEAEILVDITDKQSIENMYKSVGKIDAVIMATGKTPFKPLKEMTSEDYLAGLNHKLMGQVNVVLEGLNHLNTGGSFTLTSGILNKDPIAQGSSAAMVNSALEGFVKSIAIEMPHEIRINIVSPTVVTESMDKYADYFRGFKSVSAEDVALAYSKSVEGKQTGKIYDV